MNYWSLLSPVYSGLVSLLVGFLIGKIQKLKDAKVEEIGKEILGVYLKYITEQYGEEQTDEETGEAIGKMFAFTFQEKNDNEFHMDARQDEDGRLTMVCAVTYPEKGEDDDTGRENS